MPLFEVTNNPDSHPYLHKFLYHVTLRSKDQKLFYLLINLYFKLLRYLDLIQLMMNPSLKEIISI